MHHQNTDPPARQPIPDIKQRVEELGVFFEQTKLTPMEARVFALLLLSDPPEMDFYAIQDFLQASKSTISNALKRLMAEGRVEYITKPGDRKRYFRVSIIKWLEHIQQALASVGPFVSTLDKVITLRKDTSSPEFNRDLHRIKDYFLFLKEELPRVQAKWNEREGSDD
ncbi:GbsR/MarR family transcriptional regulator [Lewinella sp. JB7]|uniref:GbsR/MarR family transcriptional regulator n=1 Tax=Lewinella sp. JB7 TaxID=2962887 RepID=UPI0020CA0705|nr:helix-turn-helix domain-containing protein [Lewinella sp. JB7]MCP9234697.1 MarR family transcriptional regulator [Lewinella sp. JB7]